MCQSIQYEGTGCLLIRSARMTDARQALSAFLYYFVTAALRRSNNYARGRN